MALLLAIGAGFSLPGQQPDHFATISIKRSSANPLSFSPNVIEPKRLSDPHISLHALIQQAYHIYSYQLHAKGVGGWFDDDEFTVEATTDAEPSRPEMLKMLQDALADKFQLQMHSAPTVRPVFKLVAGSAGIRFRPLDSGVAPPAPRGAEMDFRSVDELVRELNDYVAPGGVSKPVVDDTGLHEDFDIRFTLGKAANGVVVIGHDDFARLSSSLESQLGLKLESGTATIEEWYVDHAEKPR